MKRYMAYIHNDVGNDIGLFGFHTESDESAIQFVKDRKIKDDVEICPISEDGTILNPLYIVSNSELLEKPTYEKDGYTEEWDEIARAILRPALKECAALTAVAVVENTHESEAFVVSEIMKCINSSFNHAAVLYFSSKQKETEDESNDE